MAPPSKAAKAARRTNSNPKPSAEPGVREFVPALVAAIVGVPLVFSFAQAMADGEVRRRESPVRALIGDHVFEQLRAGEKTEQHYYGSELSAPDFTLTDQHGKPWKLSDARGKVVLMNFWTLTCQPCVEEMPSLVALARLAEQHEDLEVVAVSTDKDWDEVKAIFPPDSKLKVLFDPDKQIVKGKYGTRLYPETWIVDRNGVIRLRVDGPREWADPLAVEVINSFL